MSIFSNFSFGDVATFIEEHQGDFGAVGLTRSEIVEALESGRAQLETRPYGFALVQQTVAPGGAKIPHLWMLYVDPTERGRKVGHKFVRELLSRYASEYHMSLYCDGAARRRFFGRLGFVVESRDGDMRRMTTNREFYR